MHFIISEQHRITIIIHLKKKVKFVFSLTSLTYFCAWTSTSASINSPQRSPLAYRDRPHIYLAKYVRLGHPSYLKCITNFLILPNLTRCTKGMDVVVCITYIIIIIIMIIFGAIMM